jgi:hypothetical protein
VHIEQLMFIIIPTYAQISRVKLILKLFIILIFLHYLYRVSIKSFPDYRHLLQENYVEYKLFFSKCNSRSFFTTQLK